MAVLFRVVRAVVGAAAEEVGRVERAEGGAVLKGGEAVGIL